MALTSPLEPGREMRTLCGLTSLWTISKLWRWLSPWVACRNIVRVSRGFSTESETLPST